MNTEKKKFRKFYSYGSIFWFLMTILYFTVKYFINGQSSGNKSVALLDGVLDAILANIIFGIPIIFILSVFIRLAAYGIDHIFSNKKARPNDISKGIEEE